MDMHVVLRLLILGVILICVLAPKLSQPGTAYGLSRRLPERSDWGAIEWHPELLGHGNSVVRGPPKPP